MKLVTIPIYNKSCLTEDNFIKESLNAIKRLKSGKCIVQTLEERVLDIFGTIPSFLKRISEVKAGIVRFPSKRHEENFRKNLFMYRSKLVGTKLYLVDVNFRAKEEEALKNLRKYAVGYIKAYFHYLMILQNEDDSKLLNPHPLGDFRDKEGKNLLGFNSIRVTENIKELGSPYILVYKVENPYIYLANLDIHKNIYKEKGRGEFEFSPMTEDYLGEEK